MQTIYSFDKILFRKWIKKVGTVKIKMVIICQNTLTKERTNFCNFFLFSKGIFEWNEMQPLHSIDFESFVIIR